MKSAFLIVIVFAVSILPFAQNTKAASAVTAFDGTWSLTLNGHEYKDPRTGVVAAGYIIHFPAKVKNGVLHGEWKNRAAPYDWFELNGKIQANGNALLNLNGVTGNSVYNISHGQSRKPFGYQVVAHFDDLHGTGNSVGGPRVRTYSFVKDKVADVYRRDPGAVVIETIVLEDKYRMILTTPDVQIPGEYAISREALRKKGFEFRDAINERRPESEIKSLGNELYQILVGPVAKNLEAYQPETLVWSLDDVLRYVPTQVLYDGSHYLAESYANVVITLGSLINLKDKPSSGWTALGLGVSKAHQNWPGLPYVPVELNGIIRTEDNGGTNGILPGRIMLDEAFTEANLRNALIQRAYQVVHIASHFKFNADGNSNDSFLLLGNGNLTKLTIAQIAAIPNLFAGVQLLTLSACETAIGDQASRLQGNQGVEVESLGVVAQRKGAAAVIASLWEVADVSTSKLMQSFYQCHAAAAPTTKAEALRQAQLDLLLHTNGEYAHPFYWAPFVVIGNWQ